VKYRGYTLRVGGRGDVQIWHGSELISREARSTDQAKKIIDDWLNAK
jgi:hypothetical protein